MYFSNLVDAIGGGNGAIFQLPGAAVRLQECSYPLANAGCELGELCTGISDDVRDEVSWLVRDGRQHIQFLLYDPTDITLQETKHVRTAEPPSHPNQ